MSAENSLKSNILFQCRKGVFPWFCLLVFLTIWFIVSGGGASVFRRPYGLALFWTLQIQFVFFVCVLDPYRHLYKTIVAGMCFVVLCLYLVVSLRFVFQKFLFLFLFSFLLLGCSFLVLRCVKAWWGERGMRVFVPVYVLVPIVFLLFFWAFDLHAAKVQLVLWWLPLSGLFGYIVYLLSTFTTFHRRSFFFGSAFLFCCIFYFLPDFNRYVALKFQLETIQASELASIGLLPLLCVGFVLLVCCAIGWRRSFGEGELRLTPELSVCLGIYWGIVFLWFFFSMRSDNGCTGVSEVYKCTLFISFIWVFGVGPVVWSRIFSEDVDRKVSNHS